VKAEMGAVVLILTGESEGIGQHTLEILGVLPKYSISNWESKKS
jgi:hypothetical protein